MNAESQVKAELLIWSPGIKAPAMQAVRKQAAEPEMNALNATWVQQLWDFFVKMKVVFLLEEGLYIL